MTKYYLTAIAAIVLVLLSGWFVWAQFDRSFETKMKTVSISPNERKESDNAVATSKQIPLAVKIPFTLTASNNISVPVVFNGTDRLDLMFHTAVDSISLTTEAAEKMQTLTMDESVAVQSWGGTGEARVSTGNRLHIGELEWKDQTIFVDGLSGPGTDGKFGPNLFANKIIEINFDNRELVIHESLPAMTSNARSKYHKLDFTEKQGSMYVAGELAIGDITLANQFMVHSGFGGTALLDDEFVRTHQLTSKLETISERELKDSFGNILRTKKVKLSSLTVGGIRFSDVPIEIFDGALRNQKVSVLGGDLLKRFNIIVDSANHHLYLAPNAFYEDAYGS